MGEIIAMDTRNLPQTMKDMHEFIIMTQEKLNVYRSALKAMNRIGMTARAREEALKAAQETAEMLLDAEAKVGEIMLAVPKASGGDRRSVEFKNATGGDFEIKNDSGVEFGKSKAEIIEESGFSQKQVERFQILANNPEAMEQAKQDARDNEDIVTRAAVFRLIKDKPHVSNNSGENEWYTPAEYIVSARKVMGTINLDPASCELANKTVQADTFYSIEDDGLSQDWEGNVWLNPPYAANLVSKFADKLVEELDNIENAIVLVNNATETEWFKTLIHEASAVCFPYTRISFDCPDGKKGQPLQGQAILYFGENAKKFVDEFSKKGWCAYPA